jgi:superfamily II DNA or RNA helicase
MENIQKLENSLNEFSNKRDDLISRNIPIEYVDKSIDYDIENSFKSYPTFLIEALMLNLTLSFKIFMFLKNKLLKLLSKFSDVKIIEREFLKNYSESEYDRKNNFVIIYNAFNKWFQENIDLSSLISKDLINKIILRPNQKEAIERLERNGLETGIHCQATGCGKSYIILSYLDYLYKNYENPKVILFTERISILNDLFGFRKNKTKEKIQLWKEKGICNLENYHLINRTTDGGKWIKEFNTKNQATILIINRAYLTLNDSYEKIKQLDLVLHDECHNTTSDKCNKFLKFCKENEIKMVGFSATPLRTGKDEAKKLIEIYGNSDNELELLTDYNFIYAINQKLIVQPEFYWFQIEKFVSNSKNVEITELEKKSLKEIILKTIPNMTSCKIVAWCGTISLCEKWKKVFEKEYDLGFKYYIDHSRLSDDDYLEFRNSKGKSILFCANKHREGSDIPKLDACLFLDKIKYRGIIPFIQSIGRVLRLDETLPEKNKGIVIDSLIKSNDYEKNVTDKIFEYYNALRNVSNIKDLKGNNNHHNWKKFIKINKETDEIVMKMGELEIKVKLNTVKWESLEKSISSYIKRIFEFDILNELNNYDFYFSKCIECIVNEKNITQSNFKPIITNLYKEINDLESILKFTRLNISTEERLDRGFNYISEFNIWIQGVDSKCSVKEIVNQCISNHLKLSLKVKLKNQEILTILLNGSDRRINLIKNVKNEILSVNL